jgi:hypothetical protein
MAPTSKGNCPNRTRQLSDLTLNILTVSPKFQAQKYVQYNQRNPLFPK